MALVKPGSGSRFLGVSLLVILLDQYTKQLVVEHIAYNTPGIQLLPCFNLVHVYNEGAAFSFLAGMGGWQRWLFMIIAVVLAVVLTVMLLRTPRSKKWTCLGLALIIGGALGNLIDRVMLGHVVDFLLFYLRGDGWFWSYPAFNVADIAVCCGAALVVLISLLDPASGKKAGKKAELQQTEPQAEAQAKPQAEARAKPQMEGREEPHTKSRADQQAELQVAQQVEAPGKAQAARRVEAQTQAQAALQSAGREQGTGSGGPGEA